MRNIFLIIIIIYTVISCNYSEFTSDNIIIKHTTLNQYKKNNKFTEEIHSPSPINILSTSYELLKYNTNNYSYIDKTELDFIKKNNRIIYIVNQGGDDISVPSCVNGKKVTQDCAPTGWRIGFKSNEVYAIRIKTPKDYTAAQIRSRINTFAGGLTLQANYSYVISDLPGKMISPWSGRCSFEDNASASSGYLTPDINADDWRCKVPSNTIFYLNIKLKDETEISKCETGVCSNYIMINGMALPSYYQNK